MCFSILLSVYNVDTKLFYLPRWGSQLGPVQVSSFKKLHQLLVGLGLMKGVITGWNKMSHCTKLSYKIVELEKTYRWDPTFLSVSVLY